MLSNIAPIMDDRPTPRSLLFRRHLASVIAAVALTPMMGCDADTKAPTKEHFAAAIAQAGDRAGV